MKNVIAYPIVYGNVSFPSYPVTTKRNQKYSNWIVYVRGFNFQDISFMIKKVVFHLHHSFQKRVREITAFPFQLKQAGWGGFQVLIQIYLLNGTMIQFKHALKLHHLQCPQSKKPYVAQYYDEIVFINPTKYQRDMIGKGQKSQKGKAQQDSQVQEQIADTKSYQQLIKYMNKFEFKQQETRLQDSIKYINSQIKNLKEKTQQLDKQNFRLYQQLSK